MLVKICFSSEKLQVKTQTENREPVGAPMSLKVDTLLVVGTLSGRMPHTISTFAKL